MACQCRWTVMADRGRKSNEHWTKVERKFDERPTEVQCKFDGSLTNIKRKSDERPTNVEWKSDEHQMKIRQKSNACRTHIEHTLDGSPTFYPMKVKQKFNEHPTKIGWKFDKCPTKVGWKFDEHWTKVERKFDENQTKVQQTSDESPTMTTRQTTLQTPRHSRTPMHSVVMVDAMWQSRRHYGACMSSTTTLWGVHELHGDGGRQHNKRRVGRCCEACVSSMVLAGDNAMNVALQLAMLQLMTLQLTTDTML